MSGSWFDTLNSQLTEPAVDEENGGIWNSLKAQLNIVEKRPAANPDVVSVELSDRNGRYHILKNQKEKTYLRLTPAQFQLFQQMNGENSVQDLIVEHYMATGNFAHAMVVRLVDELTDQHMLSQTPVHVWRALRENIEKRKFFNRVSAPARFLLTQRLAFNNLDRFITAIYRSVGWLFFTRPMQLLYILLSAAGLYAFSEIIGNPTYRFFGDNYVRGILLIWVAMILPVVVHELGHALTVKHFGREVPKGGLMLYFGMPAAFVDTTDIWLEGRKARMAVTWNGPYTGLILGGSLSLIMYFFPEFSLNSFLFKMVGYAYLTVIFNVNPLLKYDGYYILSDALEISSLRERSLSFLKKHLVSRVLKRTRLNRDEWIFTIYGILSLLWTAYALQLVSILWRTRVQDGMKVVFGAGYSNIERAFSLIMAAGVISLAVLLGIGLMRGIGQLITRHNQNGGLTRHRRLAFLLAIIAVAIGFAAPRFTRDWSLLIGFAMTSAAAYGLWQFAVPFQGAIRGTALRTLSAGIAISGLAEAAALTSVTLQPVMRWFALATLGFAGLMLFIRAAGMLKPLTFSLAPLVGLGAFFLFRWGGWPLQLQIAAAAMIIITAWNLLALLGSARSPAVLLLGAGSTLYALSWHLPAWLPQFQPYVIEITALGLLSAAALHWQSAQLPELSTDQANVESIRTRDAVALAVATIVRRVIAQVFFESGWFGVHQLGRRFNKVMRKEGLNLKIDGNKFLDDEFSNRTVIQLTTLYQLAFDTLHNILCGSLGQQMGSLTFNYGMDRLPWQNREVVLELILSRSDWSKGLSEQHEGVKKREVAMLKRVQLFVTLENEDLEKISLALDTENFASGDILMREGDPGDRFYIIERGQVSFWQKDDNGEEAHVGVKGAGQYFGEIALVSNAPRNATVRADTPLTVRSLTRARFDALVRNLIPLDDRDSSIVRRSWLLRSMPIFDELESHELEWIAANMERTQIGKNEVLFREGDPGDRFYIVESGELIISTAQDGQAVEISRCKSGEYIGEIALLQNKPRTATITAAADSTLLSLEGEDFLDLVSGYTSLGKSVTFTSSRRLLYLETLDS